MFLSKQLKGYFSYDFTHAVCRRRAGFFVDLCFGCVACYECDLTAKGRSEGWIAEKMTIAIDPNGQVIVTDGYIRHYKQDPMIAKVTKNTDQALKFRWILRNVRLGSNQLIERLNHEASFNKKTYKITVHVSLANWPGNRFSGRGSCKTGAN